jgi:hypothetical protein
VQLQHGCCFLVSQPSLGVCLEHSSTHHIRKNAARTVARSLGCLSCSLQASTTLEPSLLTSNTHSPTHPVNHGILPYNWVTPLVPCPNPPALARQPLPALVLCCG